MDRITIDLVSAIDFLLRYGKTGRDDWRFEKESEIHLALVEAMDQARIALGIDRPEIEETHNTQQVA